MAGTATPEARCAVEPGATTPLFPAEAGVPLPLNALLARARQCRLRTYASRHVIIDQGARTDHAIIVVEGWAELVMRLPDDRRQILAFAMPGDLCLDDIDSPARTDCAIVAVTPLTVAILGKFELRRLVADHAAFARDFRRNQMLSLAIQRRWTASLGRMEAIERVAHLMCEILVRQQQLGLGCGQACDWPLTQTQVSEACGLTQVHTNRVIQDLRHRGLVELGGKRLTVLRQDELWSLAQFDPSYLADGFQDL